MNLTDGVWDPTDRNAYFLAVGADETNHVTHPFLLVAINELMNKSGEWMRGTREAMERVLDSGARLLVDSGVFWLTNQHKRAHGITMDEALALPPDQIDGFDWLWRSYLNVHAAIGDRAWGFIELDQGGAVNKRITRQRLQDEGVVPMPVYHPLNDGWDYFDELAENYDRMCCGNIVQAVIPIRERLIYTLNERHRRYPHLWVHLLGYTVNEWANAIEVDSADSSTWRQSTRYPVGQLDLAMGKVFGTISDRRLRYQRAGLIDGEVVAADRDTYAKAREMASMVRTMQVHGWRHWRAELAATFGLVPYQEAKSDA